MEHMKDERRLNGVGAPRPLLAIQVHIHRSVRRHVAVLIVPARGVLDSFWRAIVSVWRCWVSLGGLGLIAACKTDVVVSKIVLLEGRCDRVVCSCHRHLDALFSSIRWRTDRIKRTFFLSTTTSKISKVWHWRQVGVSLHHLDGPPHSAASAHLPRTPPVPSKP